MASIIKIQMKFSYYGNSCFEVAIIGKKIFFDPFIFFFHELAAVINIKMIVEAYIFLSNGHADPINTFGFIKIDTGAVQSTFE